MDSTPPRPLRAAAEADWAARVRANRAQAERLREDAPGDDFYAPIAAVFRADPTRRDDSALNALLALAQPGDTWLDVGAGGGRYSLGIARAVRRVIAVEPSAGMRAVFSKTADAYAIDNTELRDQRWPGDGPPPKVDVAFISHIGYDIEAIGPFLDALEAAAIRTCVALLMSPSPVAAFASLWTAVHDEPQAELPGLSEFLSLLLARGSLPEMRIVDAHVWRFDSPAEAGQAALRRLWLSPDGAKAAAMREALARELIPDDAPESTDAAQSQRVRLRNGSRVGLVTWTAAPAPTTDESPAPPGP